MAKQDNQTLLQGYRQLTEIARDLASTLDQDQLLRRIVHAAADLTNAGEASILLYDPMAQHLNFQVATNMDEPTMRGLIVPLQGSIAGWILSQKQAVRINNDVLNDERYFRNVADKLGYDIRSLMGVPLVTKDKVVGVLEVINKKEGGFSETDEDLLTVLGAQAAVAIETTRLFQQSDLVSEFVHELRTPLAAISTATYLLLRPEITHERGQQIIASVHSEVLRLNTMTSSFLDLARLESGRVQFHKSVFPVQEFLGECVAIVQEKARDQQVRVHLDVSKDFKLEADRDKLKQVLLNLLTNAIKYNQQGGSVFVDAHNKGNEAMITVRDTGTGISQKDIPHLFEKFYRVKDSEASVLGTGLGLAIVKQIIQGHGGRIHVVSEPGKGSSFTIYLPQKAVASS